MRPAALGGRGPRALGRGGRPGGGVAGPRGPRRTRARTRAGAPRPGVFAEGWAGRRRGGGSAPPASPAWRRDSGLRTSPRSRSAPRLPHLVRARRLSLRLRPRFASFTKEGKVSRVAAASAEPPQRRRARPPPHHVKHPRRSAQPRPRPERSPPGPLAPRALRVAAGRRGGGEEDEPEAPPSRAARPRRCLRSALDQFGEVAWARVVQLCDRIEPQPAEKIGT
ncbi:serine/arginine repetitive matrix protein 1-like [Oryctolagus cuniculus]|uniref:serine/arginine repetitive matrix protein 1-like n=1 Tax=Oryctolagus cuniculus TaxID=9986 RepID=UPI0007EE44B8